MLNYETEANDFVYACYADRCFSSHDAFCAVVQHLESKGYIIAKPLVITAIVGGVNNDKS